ncbi:terminase large subunit domain-containing protein [Micromonospora sp. ATA51]|uniref:terminase large subunit domain-containing protein n=1 Tax=Micromonospora sp. ATA51 TaxID=2806098 RepID=UPI001A4E8208|nr:terminase family protein [Micromonospora sp. ATA51]MBM0226856.1 terminase family protein [Micromonospora sp. ATA51]
MLLAYPDPALMTDAELAAYLREVSEVQGLVRYDWPRHARPEQMEPAWYRIWMLLAGRGFGKTRTGAETVRKWAGTKAGGHYAVIAKTYREVFNVCFTARRAGLLAVIPPKEVRTFNKSEPYLELTNGAIIRGFGAQDPDVLRGYDFDGCWLDEYAAWPVQTAQGVFDMLWFCMREAASPRMVISTTPKPLPHVKKLLARSKKQRARSRRPRVVVTRGGRWTTRTTSARRRWRSCWSSTAAPGWAGRSWTPSCCPTSTARCGSRRGSRPAGSTRRTCRRWCGPWSASTRRTRCRRRATRRASSRSAEARTASTTSWRTAA